MRAIVPNILRKGLPPVTVLAVALLLLVGAPRASAAALPWWHVGMLSSPAKTAGGEGTIVAEASNLGEVKTSGTWKEHFLEAAFKDKTTNFIKVVDTLPAGVTPTAVHVGKGLSDREQQLMEEELFLAELFGFKVPKLCSFSGQTVTCEWGSPVQRYERIQIGITVKVAPGTSTGVNEVSVSGGGVLPAASRRALGLSASPLAYGIENYEIAPEEEGGIPDTQAGSHPFQYTTTLALNTNTEPVFSEPAPSLVEETLAIRPPAYTKDLRFNLPPGLVGNPTPLPKCSMKVFLEGGCPNNTAVGVAVPLVSFEKGASTPGALVEPMYILEPSVGEPARFAFQTIAGPVILDTSVRTGADYGVVVSVSDITDAAEFIGAQVTFWGVPADPRHDTARGECASLEQTAPIEGGAELSCHVQEKELPFVVMPTSCTGPLRTSMEADPWTEPGQFRSKEYEVVNGLGEPFGQDGCNRLNFEPSISLAPDGQQASTPTGLTVNAHVPQDASLDPSGLAESTVKDTTVTLPVGVTINPASADGLQACTLAQIGLESATEQSCPEAAKVATVEIHTPLLPNPLVGATYIASPAPFGEPGMNPFNSLVALYIVAKDPVSGVLVKLVGEVKPDPITGQLVSTFKNTPQLPFEDLTLHFFGGSRAPLGTPALCGPYTTNASFAPWAGNAPVQPAPSEFLITSGPNGTLCSDPLPFHPSLHASSTNIQAGTFTPLTATMSREDGNQNLDAIQLHTPPGLLGTLSGVTLCGEAQANAGTCGPQSLIGHTVVSVGLGSTPFTVTGGQVYITGPYEGAPYGLSVVNPAKAGPFDLGHVIVRAKIEIDPITAALTVTTDTTGPYAIPQILHGIPLQIKHVNVTIDRTGFTFNPTNCSKTTITGSLTSSQMATAAISIPFQVTNCATLGFKPQFKVSTSGHTSRKNGASLDVKLAYPKTAFGTQANIAKVKVDLPKQLPSRLTTLQKACVDTVFNANPAACPAASRVGNATATTPIIPVPLSGPAFFVSHGGTRFPELVIVLSGYGATVQLHGETFISKEGITSSTFRTIPDVPVETFELKLPQGANSALAANRNLCKSILKMPTAFTAQNGIVIHKTTLINTTNCAKHKTKSHH